MQSSSQTPVQTSVQLYTVREPLGADFTGTLQRLAEIGFTNVEGFDFIGEVDVVETDVPRDGGAAFEGDKAQRFADGLAASGLKAPTGHAHLVGQDVAAALDAAQKVGMTTVIEPMVRDEKWSTPEGVQDIAAELNAAAAQAAERGLRVGYHNHNWELEIQHDGVPALEYLARHLDAAVLLEVDLYWAYVGGIDPAGLLQRLGERVRFVHVKDGPQGGTVEQQCPAGTGAVPLREALAAAPWLELAIVEYDVYAGDVFEGVETSLNWLNGALAEIAQGETR